MPGLMMEPGPTQVDPRVIQAMCRPAIYHLDPEFVGILDATGGLLQDVLGTSGEVVVLPSTGRGGLEAVLLSACRPGDRVLVPANGVFGHMVASIARALGLSVIELEGEPGAPLDLAAVEAAAARHRPALVGVVHCETSTGMINPVEAVADIADRHGSLTLVDAIASAGGTPIHMDRSRIDFCVVAGQKALGALAGIAAVAVGERGRRRMQTRPGMRAGSYFDLERWWAMWLPRDRGGALKFGYRRLPWTMATHGVLALEAACRIIVHEETVGARWTRHRAAGRALRAGIEAMGLGLLADPGTESDTVTAFEPPDGIDSRDLIHGLEENHGIKVAGGLEELAGRIVRVAHMAETARPAPLQATLAGTAAELRRLGAKVGDEFPDAFAETWRAAIAEGHDG